MSRAVIWLSLVAGLVLLSIPAASLAAESVCLQCHAGLSGHLSAPVADWQTSVHAANGISCHDCHGGDATDMAMTKSPDKGFLGAPEYEDVPEFCGRCHVGIFEAYSAGAHGQALAEGGAQCVICHGNHAVKEAGLDLINEEDCSRCHSYERAALIRLALVETDTMINAVEQDLDRLYRLGFAVDDELRAFRGLVQNDLLKIPLGMEIQAVQHIICEDPQAGGLRTKSNGLALEVLDTPVC